MTVIPTNPFSFTNRTFNTIYIELKAKYQNKPDWFIILLAGLFDIGHWYLDATAQNTNLEAAFTEEAIRNLCRRLDYYLANPSPGGGEILVTIPLGVAPITIPKSQLTFELVPSTGETVKFEAANDLYIASGVTGSVPISQGVTQSSVNIGTSDGATEFQEFLLPSTSIIPSSVSIVINSITYDLKETLADSGPTDTHFRVITKPNNLLAVRFGNGTLGIIPPVFPILATFTVGGGASGNVKARNTIVTEATIGTSNGAVDQSFNLADKDIVFSTLFIKVGSDITWTEVADITTALSTDKVYQVVRISDGTASVLFGDGVNGAIPPNTNVIKASYVRSDASTVSYTGGNANILTFYMREDFSGGSDRESLEKARLLAPEMLRTSYRAVTENDYRVLSKKYSAAIIEAQCFPGYYGANTVGVHLVPAGGGNPSSSIKIALEAYLRARSTLGTVDVRVRNPIYVSQDISVGIKIRSGAYTFASYKQYAEVACILLVSETTTEIVQQYKELGIASAVTYINNKFGYGFIENDYPELDRIISRRIREGILLWGSNLRVNDIISVLDDLLGVESVTTPSLPTGDVVVAFDEILTKGTITITQVF